MRTSSTLPPLQSLRAFEAVSRLLSFRKAGEELLITQSAVSHHIRLLEETLGVSLFIRSARSIALTDEGEAYYKKTKQAFRLIADATHDVRVSSGRNKVHVSLLPSFAANWLVSRLAGFHAEHPDIDLDLEPTLRVTDFASGNIDIAIRYGEGPWDGSDAHLLMAEQLSPVVSPLLLGDGSKFTHPQDLMHHTLLMAKQPIDWEVWAEAVGLDFRKAHTIQLTDYNITLQAALEGHGVAIGRNLLISEHLRTGRLVQPFPEVITSYRAAHWVVLPKGRTIGWSTKTFFDWIMREAAKDTHPTNSSPLTAV
ncbi:transcriptional regulator GcvA [Phyllobacterium sp. YR531]|uniref:transcriptional regulator GcvA n=1 Tax=Phyllobacterium sp. YR531 TaxID=1144343 RepID=UPI00026F4918|nr:transcriptional regulator GcvA [Phyllobacterium sp. YR531]EJN05561.1 transcriptional regulator [Phyllobacterium sp. YR531]